jgi:hypothetical protein
VNLAKFKSTLFYSLAFLSLLLTFVFSASFKEVTHCLLHTLTESQCDEESHAANPIINYSDSDSEILLPQTEECRILAALPSLNFLYTLSVEKMSAVFFTPQIIHAQNNIFVRNLLSINQNHLTRGPPAFS